MKLVLEKSALDNFTKRAALIENDTVPSWGKMNAGKMFNHLNKSTEFLFTNTKVKRMFIGRIIGKRILHKTLKSKGDMPRNSPTAPGFIASDSAVFENEKALFLKRLTQFASFTENDFDGKIHPFFGKMTGQQWNLLIYKHFDHHLKQFNA